ncbi:hypothetical protein VSR82_00100 [Burkholderia sp. JPY481]
MPAAFDAASKDVIGRNEDCLRLLIATGICFSRVSDTEIAADGDHSQKLVVEKIVNGDELAAARLAAARLAASWVDA